MVGTLIIELPGALESFISPGGCVPMNGYQEYVSQLSTVRPEALEQAGTKIVVIGCGDWQLINNYRGVHDCQDSTHNDMPSPPPQS